MEPEKPTTSAKFILQKLLKTISRSNDHDVPLPSPFPLPQNYRADVAAALKAGQMTADTKKAFFSSIASAIFKYKKIPTREDYIDVASHNSKIPIFQSYIIILLCIYIYIYIYQATRAGLIPILQVPSAGIKCICKYKCRYQFSTVL